MSTAPGIPLAAVDTAVEMGRTDVHPAAVVSDRARLGRGVRVGPGAVIGAGVELGDRTVVGPGAVIDGETRIGADNWIGAHAVIGMPPQIRGRMDGGALHIGDHNVLRELCTVHLGSAGSTTRIGDANMLMAYAHVAHDCVLGDGVELANAVQLAGHVQVGDRAVLGGMAAVHQFVRVGCHSFVGAGAMVAQDVPPYSQVSGDRARLYGVNTVGLRRAGFSPEVRRALARALHTLRETPLLADALVAIRGDPELVAFAEVRRFVSFAEQSRRGLCRPVTRRVRGAGGAAGAQEPT